MSDQLSLFARSYPGLSPVAVNSDAMERFNLEMNRRLAEFDVLFYEPRLHPPISVPRHRGQTPRKPR